MVVHPLQSGVAEDHIVCLVLFIGPGGNVTHAPSSLWSGLTSGGNHLGRAIQPCQFTLWPALSQGGSTVAGAAAQIDHAVWSGDGDSSHKLLARSSAFVVEAKILFCIPCGHGHE